MATVPELLEKLDEMYLRLANAELKLSERVSVANSLRLAGIHQMTPEGMDIYNTNSLIPAVTEWTVEEQLALKMYFLKAFSGVTFLYEKNEQSKRKVIEIAARDRSTVDKTIKQRSETKLATGEKRQRTSPEYKAMDGFYQTMRRAMKREEIIVAMQKTFPHFTPEQIEYNVQQLEKKHLS